MASVDALIDAEADNKSWNPLIYAAKNGKIVIGELLGSNAKYITLADTLGNLPLHYTVQHGFDEMLRVFLRYKKKNKLNLLAKNHEGNTALHFAALNNDVDMIESLLIHAPELLNNQNKKEETALKVACDNHNSNAIRKLINKGASLEGITLSGYSLEIQTELQRKGRPTIL